MGKWAVLGPPLALSFWAYALEWSKPCFQMALLFNKTAKSFANAINISFQWTPQPNPLAGLKADGKQNLLNKNKNSELGSSFHQVEISI